MYQISDLKISALGVVPHFEDKTGKLSPQEILALSALLTFKGKSIHKLKTEIEEKGSLSEQVRKILLASSLRGHASMSTTPIISFAYEGSKFLDQALTGIVFASSLVTSGRRTSTTEEDIVVPSDIAKNKKALKIYVEESKKNINLFNQLLEKGIIKDEARKIYQYGIYGTGMMSISIESLMTLKKEWEEEKEWMPEEVGLLLSEIEKNLKKQGLDWLYATRLAAPKESFPYPNPFKDPKKNNLANLLRKKVGEKIQVKVFDLTMGEKKVLEEVLKEIEVFRKKHPSSWREVLKKYRSVMRDLSLGWGLKVFSSCSFCIWGEKKRHRTVPMVVESIYESIEKTRKIFQKYDSKIEKKILKTREMAEIDRYFAIPPGIAKDKNLLYSWLNRASSNFKSYEKLIKLGIKPRNALYLVPRGIKMDLVQEYNLFNLILGYYPTRMCATADEQICRLATIEEEMIKKILRRRGLSFLLPHLGPKCFLTGFCPEKKWCPKILGRVKDYNEDVHNRIHQNLEKDFERNLDFLGK